MVKNLIGGIISSGQKEANTFIQGLSVLVFYLLLFHNLFTTFSAIVHSYFTNKDFSIKHKRLIKYDPFLLIRGPAHPHSCCQLLVKSLLGLRLVGAFSPLIDL